MNEPIYTQNEEIVIDLKDLCLSLLKKWRSLAALLLAGLLLGAALGGASLSKPEEYSLEEQELLEKAMPDLEQALRYRQVYQQQLLYFQESPAMQLDPNSVYIGKLIYSITAKTGLEAILVQYENIMDDDLTVRLCTASTLDFEKRYIQELVSQWKYSQSSENSTTEELTTTVDCMVYQVQAPSEESCAAMLQIFKDALAELDTSLSRTNPTYEASILTETVTQADPRGYLSTQENQVAHLHSCRLNMQNAEKAFSDLEKRHYATMTGEELSQEENPLKTIVKGMLLGAVLSGFCWGGWFCLVYLLDGRIKTPEELRDSFRLPYLGCLARPKEGQPWDMQKAAYLAQLTVYPSGQSICLCAEAEEALQNLLCQNQPFFVPAPMPTAGKDALILAQSHGQAVLLIPVGKTTRKDLQDTLRVCSIQNIRILGVIAITE